MQALWALPGDRAALIGLLLAARVVPIFLLAPFFGGRALPVWARAALGLSVAALLAPALAGSVLPALAPLGQAELAGLVIKEVAIGVTLGLLVTLPFAAAAAAGGLIDGAAGGVPAGEGGPAGRLLGQLAVVLFVTLDGHHVFLRGLAQAYQAVPVWRPLASGAPAAVLEAGLRGGAQLVAVALALAAPVLAALLLADLTMGVLARAAPLPGGEGGGAALRSLLGAAALLLALGAMVTVLRAELAAMLRELFAILSSL